MWASLVARSYNRLFILREYAVDAGGIEKF